VSDDGLVVRILAKFVADSVEEIDSGPMEAVRSVGGDWWKALSRR